MPPAPEGLGPHGQGAWESTLAKVLEGRFVTELDLVAFAKYCRTFDEIARLDELIFEEGEVYETDKGSIVTHPYVTQRFRWFQIQERYEREFWLTPTSRAGKQGAPQKKQAGVRTRKRG